jgi:hypothetical protein
MATDNVKVLKIDTGQAQTSVKDLRTELKALKDTMLSTQQGTEEYNQALQRAAEITHDLKEQTEEVNASAMDFGQIASNCTKAVGGMVAGFQAAKATMNLFGIENEAVLQSLEKMQNLMAITQALPSIDNGIKAFKRLKLAIQATSVATSSWGKALIATGIGAIVVALGLLIANFDKISQWLDELTGQTDFLGELSDKVIGGLNAGWAAIVQSLKAVGNAIVTYVTTPFKAVWNAIQAYTSTDGGFADKLKAAGKAMKDGFVSDWKKVGDDFKEVGTVAAAAYQSGYEKHKAKRLAKDVEDAKEAGKAEGKAKGEAKAEAEEAAYKKRMKTLDKEEREEMLKLQQMGLNYEEYVAKKQAIEDEFNKKRIEALQNILATEVGLTEDEIATLQDELIKLQDSLYKKPEKAEESSSEPTNPEAITAKQISEAINASAAALNDFSDNPAWGNILKNVATLTANWDNLNSQIKEGGEKAFSAYADIAAAGLGAVANMLNGLAAEQDASNKEGFESQKKLQIAGATMSMLAGIASAWASSMQLGPIAGPILGAILSAMMLATGIAQIVKIKNTKFDSKGSTSAGASPNTAAIASVTAPVQYTQDVQGANIEGAIKNQKVYVTETDITDTQDKVAVTENEAKY